MTTEQGLIWASSGGGWRAMTADLAFANVYSQAGLIDNSSSRFDTVSTESGASWFSTQFFYSPEFFGNVTQSTPSELSGFVQKWFDSYLEFFLTLTPNAECDFLFNITNVTAFETLADFCNLFVDYNGSWAYFVTDFLSEAANSYGDFGLTNRTLNGENRVNALKNTDLYIQTSLVPMSRIRQDNEGVYVGPSGRNLESNPVYSLPVCMQWVIRSNESFFHAATSNDVLPFNSYEGGLPEKLRFEQWEQYPFFPENYPDVDTVTETPLGTRSSGVLQDPFGGDIPTVAQMASASSAAIGLLSPLVPSTLLQYLSISLYDIQNLNVSEADKRLLIQGLQQASDLLYDEPIFDDISVCSQWPQSCRENDGRFIDGTFSDSPTLALNLGLYQMENGVKSNEALKIIITSDAGSTDAPQNVIAYFNTTFNQNIPPGEVLWPEEYSSDFSLPLRSPEIFDTYLTGETLNDMSMPLNGTNVTYALLSTTTIDNPAYMTKSGQPVEILLLRLNYEIPTIILGVPEIQTWTPALVEMSQEIASSDELVDLVRTFYDGEATSSPTSIASILPTAPVPTLPAPTPAPTEGSTASPTSSPEPSSRPTQEQGTGTPSASPSLVDTSSSIHLAAVPWMMLMLHFVFWSLSNW